MKSTSSIITSKRRLITSLIPLLSLGAVLLQSRVTSPFYDYLVVPPYFYGEESSASALSLSDPGPPREHVIVNGVRLTRAEQEEAFHFCQFSLGGNQDALKLVHIHNHPTLSSTNEVVRILCYVHTISPHQEKIQAVLDTWGPQCDKLLFISNTTETTHNLNNNSAEMIDLPLIAYDHKHLWDKSQKSFHYIHEHYNNYDWYYKADDDTYVVMENLRHYLSQLSVNQPLLVGHLFMLPDETASRMSRNQSLWSHFQDQYGPWIYPSGGAGYAFNQRALDQITQHLRDNDPSCFTKKELTVVPEDAATGFCARSAGVILPETRDSKHRQRFHFTNPGGSYRLGDLARQDNWVDKYHYGTGGLQKGKMAVSEESVSFHYNKPPIMYYVDAQLYHCHRYNNSQVPAWFRELLYDLKWVRVYDSKNYDKIKKEREKAGTLLVSTNETVRKEEWWNASNTSEISSSNSTEDSEIYERKDDVPVEGQKKPTSG